MNIEVITAPLIGGVIGLITNSLAIKMLFRPYKKVQIAGIQVPFTPGLIPKEKPRIARAIAQVISNYILDNETILAALASDSIRETYEQKYDEWLIRWRAIDSTCGELLEKYHLSDSVNIMETKLRDSVGSYLIEQLKKEDIVRIIINQAFVQLKDNMNPLLYKVGKNAIDAAKESVIKQMDEMLIERGPEFIGQYIDNVYIECLEKPVSEVVGFLEERASEMQLKQLLWDKYKDFIENKFGQFLSALDIQGIMEAKINDYDLAELEKMIMEISEKELHALVWLGGLLGMIMGFVNLLF